MYVIYSCYFKFWFSLFIYFEGKSERETASRRGVESEGEKESQASCLHCQRRAWRRAQIHELWDHDLSWNQELMLSGLSHRGAPKNNFLNVYFWKTDTEFQARSRLWAVSTDPTKAWAHEPDEIMTWAKVRSLTDRATQAPLYISIKSWVPKFCHWEMCTICIHAMLSFVTNKLYFNRVFKILCAVL